MLSRLIARKRRRSDVLSSELIWQVPDYFLCVESLGAPYTRDTSAVGRMGFAKNSSDMVSSKRFALCS